LLHPGVHFPFAVSFLCGADLALCELTAEFEECFAGVGVVFNFAQGSEALDGRFSGRHELLIV
jgi:hypothetical protein